MESLLLIVTLIALALGAVMSLAAWRLLRDSRARSAARVEALQALAHGEAAHASAAPFRRLGDADEELADQRHWDLALRRDDDRPAVSVTAAPTILTAVPAPVRLAQTPPPARLGPPQPLAARVTLRHVEPAQDLISSSAMFGAEAAPAAPSRRWFALVAVAGVMVLGAGAAYSLRTWDVFGAIANAAASPRDTQPLELLSLRHATDDAGTFTVTGLVHNPQSGRPLRGVVAVIYLFDQQGRFLSSGRAAIDVPAFQPGDESPFIVKIPAVGAVTRYRVGFRYTDGAVVAHVDRRGQLPDGTMENALEPAHQPQSSPAPLGPRGSEG